jgi:chromosome segregation ATPase
MSYDHMAGAEIDRLETKLEKLTAERDEARADLAECRDHTEATEKAHTAMQVLKDAAEVREAALRKQHDFTVEAANHSIDNEQELERQVAALRAALVGVMHLPVNIASLTEWHNELITQAKAALAAPDPSAWVRREELEAVQAKVTEKVLIIGKIMQDSLAAVAAHRAELRRVAEAAWDAGFSAGDSSAAPSARRAHDLTALLEGTR